jgi:hypothetical protein
VHPKSHNRKDIQDVFFQVPIAERLNDVPDIFRCEQVQMMTMTILTGTRVFACETDSSNNQ